MEQYKEVKYYPDKFYIRLDGCDLSNLFATNEDFTLSNDQAVFIHEYYHYLSNLATFQGVRSFHAAFCDLFRLVTILTYKNGLNAFPVERNNLKDCAYEIQYWNDLNKIFREDNVNISLSLETSNSPSRSFKITNISIEYGDEFKVKKNGVENRGRRELLKIDVEGLLQTTSFYLPIGAIDEFLSSSIDEFLFEKGLSDNKGVFKRPFYPYFAFDEILKYFNLEFQSREKIIIAYYAIHSKNPTVSLFNMLSKLQMCGKDGFEKDPCNYLESISPIFTQYDDLIREIDSFIQEAKSQNRRLTSHLLSYFQDRFITAQALLKKEPLFFIRPFLIEHLDDIRSRQEFWIDFIRIKTCFPEPLMIQGKEFVTTRPSEYGADLTILALAIFEIMESLGKNQVAKRLPYYKDKYNYPKDADNSDDVSTFTDPPLRGYWHKALNELGLYQFYRNNIK